MLKGPTSFALRAIRFIQSARGPRLAAGRAEGRERAQFASAEVCAHCRRRAAKLCRFRHRPRKRRGARGGKRRLAEFKPRIQRRIRKRLRRRRGRCVCCRLRDLAPRGVCAGRRRPGKPYGRVRRRRCRRGHAAPRPQYWAAVGGRAPWRYRPTPRPRVRRTGRRNGRLLRRPEPRAHGGERRRRRRQRGPRIGARGAGRRRRARARLGVHAARRHGGSPARPRRLAGGGARGRRKTHRSRRIIAAETRGPRADGEPGRAAATRRRFTRATRGGGRRATSAPRPAGRRRRARRVGRGPRSTTRQPLRPEGALARKRLWRPRGPRARADGPRRGRGARQPAAATETARAPAATVGKRRGDRRSRIPRKSAARRVDAHSLGICLVRTRPRGPDARRA
ncbi:hypothetical protein M885DRAFT_505279 [Pelagophyceae sp. CCMP2097]|nr:hypothetical protein M885DRAFT_505279 [Pelagophyceae sp. CCMP2097]